jgi:hypothetical protein
MSGLELIGLAASILQIADLGWKSSYKLYAFSKKVHDAGKAIELVSQDIAATGAILKQLGEEVKKDEEATPASRLSTQGLIVAASKLVDECKTLFKEIDQGITGEGGSKVILGFKQKLKWSYLEPRLDLLRTNLERLKSSLALMLNVLIYAEQQRTRQGPTVLAEQRILVASLAEQKNDSEKRIEELKKRIEAPAPPPYANPEEVKASTQPTSSPVPPETARSLTDPRSQPPRAAMNIAATRTSVTANLSAIQIAPLQAPDKSALPASIARKAVPLRATTTTPDRLVGPQPPAGVAQPSPLEHHRLLFDSLLNEVNSSKYALDHGLRYRLHDGVLELHWREWQPLREKYGDQTLQAILGHSPVLARHWYEMATKPATRNPPNVEPKSERDQFGPPETTKVYDQLPNPDTAVAPKLPQVEESRPGLDPTVKKASDEVSADRAREFLLADAASQPRQGGAAASLPAMRANLRSDLKTYGITPVIPAPVVGDNTSQDRIDGAYGDKVFSAEESEEEDFGTGQKQEIRFMKSQDVSSTRNALRAAAQAEETGRATLARLGAQGERLHNTDRNLDIGVNAQELKTLNRSMFAVHVNNPFVHKDRRTRGEEQILNQHEAQRDAATSKKPNPLALRAKYQFEEDSEDDEMENEILLDTNLEQLSGAAKRLNLLSRATGAEAEASQCTLSSLSMKVGICFIRGERC